MKKEDIIAKIQKLLNLQFSAEKVGSIGEAYQAAKMVKKLLMEYNLSMSDIDISDGHNTIKLEKSEDVSSGSLWGNHWKFNLLGTIAENNLCKAYRRMNGKMLIVGSEANVAIVNEFYTYLYKTFVRLGKHQLEKKELEYNLCFGMTLKDSIKRKFIRSYLEGVPYGLQKNYDSLKSTPEETALVACHSEAIDEYIKNNFEFNNSNRKQRQRSVYGDAFDLGISDGRNINLSQQIGFQTQQCLQQ